MNYYFELRKDKINKNGLIPVRLVVTATKIKIRRNLPEVKTLIEDWDNDHFYIKSHKKHPLANEYGKSNKELQLLKEKLDKIASFFEYNEIEFTESLFLEKFESDKVSITIDFYDAIDEFITLSKLTKANGTVKKYTTVKNFLGQFHEHTKYPIRFDTINTKFEEEFMSYCFNERKTLNNYYGKLISIIKTIMQWTFDKGYHNNIDFKRMKRTENEIEVIYLDKDELMKLFTHDFNSERLNKTRDFFCFGCFTGLRHSDIMNLSQANIYPTFMQLNLIKTKTMNHRIELNKFANQILDKYRNTIFAPIPKITSQKLNKNLQECCEIIGMDEEFTISRFIGSKRINTTYKKYELITSHVARKTFVTNSLIFGMNERVLREITHHTDEKSLKRYLKIPNSLMKQEMESSWDSKF